VREKGEGARGRKEKGRRRRGVGKVYSPSQAAQSRCTVVRPIQKSIGKWEIRPPVKS